MKTSKHREIFADYYAIKCKTYRLNYFKFWISSAIVRFYYSFFIYLFTYFLIHLFIYLFINTSLFLIDVYEVNHTSISIAGLLTSGQAPEQV